jgi:hypothetical protein
MQPGAPCRTSTRRGASCATPRAALRTTGRSSPLRDDVDDSDDDWLDHTYPRRLAEPGDLTVAVVRIAPWVAVLIVLAIIFVFTAYARTGGGGADLVGRCIVIDDARAHAVACDQPNEGRVASVVDRRELCPSGTSARGVAREWYCLRPAAGER